MRFEDLKIAEPILKALHEKGYVEPTPIQAKAIPLVLDRKDVLGCAQTGTGKTAAFSLPIIQLINAIEAKSTGKPVVRSLIVTPTRELAIQIDENIKAYSKHTNIRSTVIFGGVKQGAQVAQLKKGVHILTATPGRLLDLIGQGLLSIETVGLFVLDEADRMLDMGFIHDIRKLLELLPEKRQSLFFSATMPKSIKDLSQKILNDPVRVEVTPPSSTAETVQQSIYYTNRKLKKDLLLHVLESNKIEQALIFTRTKHGADRVARFLTKQNIKSSSIHGDKAQNQRQKALTMFKEGKLKTLVATDIAARGIDIDKLRYVINFEVPNMPETYVHRIGRSGRAGEEGNAIALCEPEENAFVKDIEKLTKTKITVIADHPFPQTEKPMTEAEKKEWEKEKQRRKQEFFANRKKSKEERGGGRGRGGRNEKSRGDKPKAKAQGRKTEVKAKANDPQSKERTDKPRSEGGAPKSGNGQGRGSGKGKENSKSKGRSGGKGKRRSTDMSPSLKNKFMWPLEK